jgi:hypothetical protein
VLRAACNSSDRRQLDWVGIINFFQTLGNLFAGFICPKRELFGWMRVFLVGIKVPQELLNKLVKHWHLRVAVTRGAVQREVICSRRGAEIASGMPPNGPRRVYEGR